MARRTIKREASLTGIGLHTGAATTATCRPASSGSGVVFRRTDLAGTPEIRARLDQVAETERRTALGKGEHTIHTVEHLLAAVAALEIDDLVIDIDGPEPPIADGSFAPYVKLLTDAGTATLAGDPVVYRVTASVSSLT